MNVRLYIRNDVTDMIFPVFLLNLDMQSCHMTQPCNSSLRTHPVFYCFANEMTEGQKLGETRKRLCKEEYCTREQKVSPHIIFTLPSAVLHAMYYVYVKNSILWEPLGQNMTGCCSLSMVSFMFFLNICRFLVLLSCTYTEAAEQPELPMKALACC